MGRPINVVNLHYYFIMRRKESGLDLFQHWQRLIQPEHMIKAGIYGCNCQRKLIVNWELWVIMAFAIKPFLSYLSQHQLQTLLLFAFSSLITMNLLICKWNLIYIFKLRALCSSIMYLVCVLYCFFHLNFFSFSGGGKGEVTLTPLCLRHSILHFLKITNPEAAAW